MRVSVVARFVSHPNIEFGAGSRAAGSARRLGLPRTRTVFHPRRSSGSLTISALRPATSRFRFPTVGRLGQRVRRPEPSRARRA